MLLLNVFDIPLTTPVVYAIVDFADNHFYIGSSVRGANHRYKEHLRSFRKRNHANYLLQDKFETSNLLFIPFVQVLASEAIAVEQRYLDQFFDHQVVCMNLLRRADSWLGKKHNESSKAKISKANKGRKHPSIGLANKNRIISDETRQKLSMAHKGRKHGPHPRKGMPGTPCSEALKQHFSKMYKKHYLLTSVDGTAYEVHGLVEFCKGKGLDAGALIRVAKGRQKAHKGWICSSREDRQ